MAEYLIPIFPDRRVVIFRSTNAGVLDFEGSKIYPKEFNLQVPVYVNARRELVEDAIRNLERRVLERFFDDEFLYLTARNEHWERIVSSDGRTIVYHATVSATYVKMVQAFDDTITKVIKGR